MSRRLSPELGTITEDEKWFIRKEKKRQNIRKNMAKTKYIEWRKKIILEHRKTKMEKCRNET